LIEESGISYTFLRPNEFMQGFINFQGSTIKSNNAFYIPAEDAKVSFVDARDIAAIAVKALVDGDEHYNKIYWLQDQKHCHIIKPQRCFPIQLERK
jgi:uncharacterized protein YbjT (DUF2867 family)